ncbi:MAG: alpha/beta hydrolase [Proteobacteria bacterium]|nr:MAG: alpha/beta hydrolase [Pseudomonadota bacterium]
MPFIDVNNAQIYFETNGETGPWITLVNGHTRSSKDFRLLARHLVEAGFQVLIFDNRGSGQTKTTAPYTATDMVQDVYAIWEKFSIKKSFVVGLSMGGMLSEIIASERDITGLVLVSTGAGQQDINPISNGSWGTTIEEVTARMSNYFTEGFASRNKLLIEAMNKQILQSIQNDSYEEKAQEQRAAIRNINNQAILERIKCPTLIIHGSEDQIIKVEAAHNLNVSIPNAELKVIEGAGHLLLAEDSKTLAKSIIDFCQANRA